MESGFYTTFMENVLEVKQRDGLLATNVISVLLTWRDKLRCF